jgi:cyclopropane fatty-acyl-phospholipid synthase-like methyltransferase
MTWVDFWNAPSAIYVSDRHKDAHYRGISRNIASHISPGDTVLDFGCGEALFAGDVAKCCKQLFLSDAAPNVRTALEKRFAGIANISVLAPSDLNRLAPKSVDVIIVNSVAQYLSREELLQCIETFKSLLADNGKLVFADIIPSDVGMTKDVRALLLMAAKHRFIGSAVLGLVRTFFSPYRKKRTEIGLTTYDEKQFLSLLNQCGLSGVRSYPNFGHNQSRMAFVAHRDRQVSGSRSAG